MAQEGPDQLRPAGPGAGLESEASKALNENDMSKAYFAAAQLVATVDAIPVNRAFIQAEDGAPLGAGEGRSSSTRRRTSSSPTSSAT